MDAPNYVVKSSRHTPGFRRFSLDGPRLVVEYDKGVL
jgi:hypothetical protein